MKFSIKSVNPEKQRSACVVVGVFEQRKLTEAAEAMDKIADGYISGILRKGDMRGKAGSTLMLHDVPNTAVRASIAGGAWQGTGDSAIKATVTRYAPLSRHCMKRAPLMSTLFLTERGGRKNATLPGKFHKLQLSR